ncbi:MAG: DUF2157 domain-containing protein [Gammaproteobacteria bacterium]|nr:DUF2157 domain-containing protein [Gammaproteobacteria bacterium]
MNTDEQPKGNSILKIFNYIGATLIFLGISYFICDNWSSLNNFVKIFSTLGSAIAALLIGFLLSVDKKYGATGAGFFMIAGLILPIGLFITFDILKLHADLMTQNVWVASICLVVFLAGQILLPRTILLLFTILFASLFFVALTNATVQHSNIVSSNLFIYQCLTIGLSYLFLGRYLDYADNPLVGTLYFFGCLFVLTSSFDLAGYLFLSEGSVAWKIVAVALLISSFLLAVPLRSKSLLYIGAIFLLVYVANLTTQFESLFGSIGWPIILIISGFLLMLLGYLIYFIHQRIKKS